MMMPRLTHPLQYNNKISMWHSESEKQAGNTSIKQNINSDLQVFA
jgi:hypothetical protein